ncbi:Crp/Fnr family transcriptional regulator [Arachidicoccus sp.]|uniref:Crp/Fnr family transcriptional regulator n=1 Tax=Arachidicoccus sp. TaxID=1872624 RepID=UPI003D234D1C
MSEDIFSLFESYISRYCLFSEKEIATIKSLAISKQIKKRQYLLRQGCVCRYHTFVCSGCLRSYRIDNNGNEHIFALSPVNHWMNDRLSLVSGTPSNDFIDALEDTVIIQFSEDSFKSLLREIPNFNILNTKIIAEECSSSRDRIYMMLSHQAEERYRQFIRCFPQLHNRIPIYIIASYLGITRETLTRIRTNMVSL